MRIEDMTPEMIEGADTDVEYLPRAAREGARPRKARGRSGACQGGGYGPSDELLEDVSGGRSDSRRDKRDLEPEDTCPQGGARPDVERRPGTAARRRGKEPVPPHEIPHPGDLVEEHEQEGGHQPEEPRDSMGPADTGQNPHRNPLYISLTLNCRIARNGQRP
jgi:hypothetical protein